MFTQSFAQVGQKAEEAAPFTEIIDFLTSIFLGVPRFIGGVVIFLFSLWLARIVTRVILSRIATKLGEDSNTQQVIILLRRTIYSIITILGGILALQVIGFSDITTIFGFLGFGIGFAFKDLLANFIAGVVILTQKKFQIGDLVEVDEKMGYITEIEARTTQIQDLNGSLIVIPNNEMLTNMVRNYTANSFRRIDMKVGVHYEDDLEKTKEVMLKIMKNNKNIVPEPAPTVLFTEFGESSINLEARFWIESTIFWPEVKSQIIMATRKAFAEEKLTIPFPIRTIAFDAYDENVKKFVK